MLEQTFIYIPGVGKRTEQELWASGIPLLGDADRFEKRFGHVSARLQQKLDDYIPRSREAIKRKDAGFFDRLSALWEAWRLFLLAHSPQRAKGFPLASTQPLRENRPPSLLPRARVVFEP
jgi:hypothetical protein